MALLGVLLGITMCAVAALGVYLVLATGSLALKIEKGDERIEALENRKAPLPEITQGAESPMATFPKIRMRAWNEDAVIPEVTK